MLSERIAELRGGFTRTKETVVHHCAALRGSGAECPVLCCAAAFEALASDVGGDFCGWPDELIANKRATTRAEEEEDKVKLMVAASVMCTIINCRR